MRWSQAFIPTLRDDPADAEAVSHRLLVRGGFVRRLAAGHYTMLPLGQRVRRKIDRIIREEMDAIGGQQFHLPAMHPAAVWQKSGRWYSIGDEMFRLTDRKGVDTVLGMTHEEVFALLATEITSYKQLPQVWYQIQTKFRDEPRPKAGVLRTREFTMKDAYSLGLDQAQLDGSFDDQHGAYERIFARFGLEAYGVEASSGAMGGSESVEFMVASDAGEDDILSCETCDYRANLERATSRLEAVDDPAEVPAPTPFDTPDIRTIAALAEAFPDRAGAERQIKTLVHVVDGDPVLVLLRGDHNLQGQKLVDLLGTEDIRVGNTDEIVGWLGAHPGSLGAVGVDGIRIIADRALQGRKGMVTGANTDDVHFEHVDVERDIDVDTWHDLREVRSGEPCPVDGGSLRLWRGIEVGHIFKLGTKYSEAMGAVVQDEEGVSSPIVMGSYGIGLERAMAAIVEANHDERGIVWPMTVAPYEVGLVVVRGDDEDTARAARDLYAGLIEAGVDALIDDRAERPGVKFADGELIGIPLRVTVGPRGVAAGSVEMTVRAGLATEDVAIDELVERVVDQVVTGRSVGR